MKHIVFGENGMVRIKAFSEPGEPSKFIHLTFSDQDISIEVANRHTAALVKHIESVREAGFRLGVNEQQLNCHDDSKWSDEEFLFYALNFHGQGSPVDSAVVSAGFASAWLHHIHHNPHHWQHWIFPDGYSPKNSGIENGVAPMPFDYALEMVADWMGASMVYTGSWDMTDWLYQNMPKIRLHSETAAFVRSVLTKQGYGDVVSNRWFSHEDPERFMR